MKNKRRSMVVAVSILMLSILLGGCAVKNPHIIDQEEARERMEKGATIVDVRTEEEYNKGHIPGVVLLPIENIKSGDYGELNDKDAEILLYCRTGRRAEDALIILEDAGYSNVYSFGGILEWEGEVVTD